MQVNYKYISVVLAVFLLGALGALFFNISLMPYFLASTYFENYQFVKDYKQGKIVVNKTDQVYIQENTAMQNAIVKVEPLIVAIQGKTLASGFIATSDGSVLTLASAIPADGKFSVFLAGQSTDFKIVKVDYKNNLALLKLTKNNLQTVAFADSDRIKLGQNVFLVAPTSTAQDNWFAGQGIISQISQDGIETNIEGKSAGIGGPLFNPAGEVVGINFIGSSGNIATIPINKIQDFMGI